MLTKTVVLIVAITASSLLCSAADFSFTGTFTDLDQVQYFTFTVSTDSTVVIRTYGYAGGTNAAGVAIPRGGFDPTIALFHGTDASAPLYKTTDDRYLCASGRDLETGVCYDIYWEGTAQPADPNSQVMAFEPGTYVLALTNYGNFNKGLTLGEGFSGGGSSLTCAGVTRAVTPGVFTDCVGTTRDGHWALDISGVDSAQLGIQTSIPKAALSATALTFAPQQVGTTSSAQLVSLSNGGNGPLSITSIAIGGTNQAEFAQTNDCGTSLAAGAACTISVTMTPSAAVTLSANLLVSDAVGTQSASLTGGGIAAGAALSPTSITFAPQLVGSTSAMQTITLSNPGNASLSITSIALGGANAAQFTQTNSCGSSLAAGASCAIGVTMAPAGAGALSATLVVTDAVGVQSAALNGSGMAAQAVLSPTALTFAPQKRRTQSAAQAVTLSNRGNAALSISGITISGTDAASFSQTNRCGATLAAGASCTISVKMKPTTVGALSATLAVRDSAGTQAVTLTGTGK